MLASYLLETPQEEFLEEAGEQAERNAHRQLASAFFVCCQNNLYREVATEALAQPDQPNPRLLLLGSLLGDSWHKADPEMQGEVNRWLSGLSEG